MVRTSPVAFAGCAGHLTLPAAATVERTGVVLCRSWGVDELCTRKFLRTVADDFAGRGFPVLRFDYPGTVDSLDRPESETLDGWTDAAAAACDLLTDAAGCRDVVLLGLGPGALIAARLAVRREDVAGLILAAPAANGRRFLRETAIKARVVLEGLGLPPDDVPPEGSVAIGGLVLPAGVAAGLGTAAIDAGAFGRRMPCLVVAREETEADAALGRAFEAAGHAVTVQPFAGYAELMANPTDSVLPRPVVAAMSEWLAGTYAHGEASRTASPSVPAAARLAGEGFVEEGVVFRPDAPLAGILCRPDGPSVRGDRPVAVFLNAGYDHHGGWARCWVDAARALARDGMASLRFDLANVGDSPARAGEPDQVLYTDGPIRDVVDALDFLQAACPGRVVLVGRCSGAYTAFHAACRDPRVAALALINQLRLIWDPDENLATVAHTRLRSAGEYRKRLLDPRLVLRILRGESSVPGFLRALSFQLLSRLSHALAPFVPSISKHGRFQAECRRMFAELDRRQVPIGFLCSHGDESLEQLSLYFGRDRRRLRRFARARVDILPDADHNVTLPAARQEQQRWLQDLVSTVDRG